MVSNSGYVIIGPDIIGVYDRCSGIIGAMDVGFSKDVAEDFRTLLGGCNIGVRECQVSAPSLDISALLEIIRENNSGFSYCADLEVI